MKPLCNFLHRAVASLCFLGYTPFIPGTVGSLVTVTALWYGMQRFDFSFSTRFWLVYWVVAMVLVVISILFSSRSQELFGKPDSGHIIIDEVAGQFITFLFIPFNLMTLALGFAFFRLYDVVKPFPVHKMEELDGGVGVTMDDVAAGVMANLSLLVVMTAYQWLRGRI